MVKMLIERVGGKIMVKKVLEVLSEKFFNGREKNRGNEKY